MMEDGYGHTPGCMSGCAEWAEPGALAGWLEFGAAGALVVVALAACALLVVARTGKEEP